MIRLNKILVTILIVAALLRFIGTKPGYNQFHADEGITYSAAVSMIKNDNLDPLRYDYPALVPLINYSFFRVIFIPISWAGYLLGNISKIVDGLIQLPLPALEYKRVFQDNILGERNLNALIWGRYVTAFFSLANVFLLYILARKLFNKNVALVAALLLTFNFKHVINSHIGLPDIYNSFFVLLTLLASVNLWKSQTARNYLFASAAVGLSISVKYQVFALFPFLLSHFFGSWTRRKIDIKKLTNKSFIMSGFVILLVFILINPYHFLYLDRTIDIVTGVSSKYGMGTKRFNIFPFSYFYHIDFGPPVFIAVVIGLFVALVKHTKKALFLLSHVVPYMFIMVYFSIGGFYVRNFITTTPILMMFAAIAFWEAKILISRGVGERMGRVTFAIILLTSVFVPGKNAIINSYSYTKPWGYDLMRPWVADNLPKEVIVAAHPFDGANLQITNTKTEFEIAGNYSIPEHQEAGAEYGIVNLNWAGNPFYFWMNYGFDEVNSFWNKPLAIMRNTFHGIAMEEMFRYQIYAVTKPWQAPDTHLLVIKFPDWPDSEMVELKKFSFDNDLEGWKIYGNRNDNGLVYLFDKENGSESAGSAMFVPGVARYSSARLTSVPIPIRRNRLYTVEANLRTDRILKPREREGFVRIDFYEDKNDLESVGIQSAVSSRVFGTDDWTKKILTDRAPDKAKFITVSFQTYITTRTKLWLDDVIVRESLTEVADIASKPPYEKKEIDLNYIYPNSHGNL